MKIAASQVGTSPNLTLASTTKKATPGGTTRPDTVGLLSLRSVRQNARHRPVLRRRQLRRQACSARSRAVLAAAYAALSSVVTTGILCSIDGRAITTA